MLCEFGSFNMMEHSKGCCRGFTGSKNHIFEFRVNTQDFFGLVLRIKISATRKKLISVPSLINMGCTHNKSHE